MRGTSEIGDRCKGLDLKRGIASVAMFAGVVMSWKVSDGCFLDPVSLPPNFWVGSDGSVSGGDRSVAGIGKVTSRDRNIVCYT